MSCWNWNSNGLLIEMKRGRQFQRNDLVPMSEAELFQKESGSKRPHSIVYHLVKGKRFRQLPADGPITLDATALSPNLLSTFIIRTLKCFYGWPHTILPPSHNFMVQHLNSDTDFECLNAAFNLPNKTPATIDKLREKHGKLKDKSSQVGCCHGPHCAQREMIAMSYADWNKTFLYYERNDDCQRTCY